MKNMKENYDNLKERVSILENETIVNKRVNLMNTVVNIPVSTTTRSINQDITLSDSIGNYKYLEFQLDIINSEGGVGDTTEFKTVERIVYNNTNTVNWGDNSEVHLSVNWATDSGAFTQGWFKNDKTFHIAYSCSSSSEFKYLRIKNIYGIK